MKPYPVRSIVSAIGTIVAVVTAVSLPAGFFLSGYINLTKHLDFKAELNASYLAKYITAHSALWQYQKVRIAELLSQTDGSDTGVGKRIVDRSDKLVLEEGGPVPGPTVVRGHTIIVAGATEGVVQLEASLRPLLQLTAIMSAFSALLGFAIYFAIRLFPLRILDRTLSRLEKTNLELAKTNGRFNAALTNMSQGLCMYDAQGRIVLFNERYQVMMGIPAEALKGRTMADICRDRHAAGKLSGDPDALASQVMADVRGGKSVTRIMEGNGRAVHIVDQPMPGGGWVATFEDITEKREAEAKITHMALPRLADRHAQPFLSARTVGNPPGPPRSG